MPKLKITHFDTHAGRGEVARMALFIGGVAYEDRRIPFAERPALKSETPRAGYLWTMLLSRVL